MVVWFIISTFAQLQRLPFSKNDEKQIFDCNTLNKYYEFTARLQFF